MPRWRELLLVVAVTGLLQALPAGLRVALRYDRAGLEAGQCWRLVSAHLVHLSFDHWALNMAGLAGLWWLYVERASRTQWLAIALWCALVIDLGLYVLAPSVNWYVGLSGVLHGLWAAAAVAMWRQSRTESIAALALLGVKLAYEYVYGPLSSSADGALIVVSEAHRYGALAGLLGALLLPRWRNSL
jgi:rhomboid family GlyGly-CTERM serine protease